MMSGSRIPEMQNKVAEADQLFESLTHQDNLLAARVSVFLLAESILIAVTAALVNTIASIKVGPGSSIRLEIFIMAIILGVAGFVLTLIFWYIFTLNFINVGVLLQELDRAHAAINPNNIRLRVKTEIAERRNHRWFYRVAFRRKGMNWIIVNALPAVFLFLWSATAVFSFIIFFS